MQGFAGDAAAVDGRRPPIPVGRPQQGRGQGQVRVAEEAWAAISAVHVLVELVAEQQPHRCSPGAVGDEQGGPAQRWSTHTAHVLYALLKGRTTTSGSGLSWSACGAPTLS
ncbi:hypothetical protein GCM10009642_43910 [Nocardiopsis metallicus]